MKITLITFLLILNISTAYAENYAFTIPAKNLILSFNSPPLSKFESKSNKSQSQFKANSFNGFNLSYFFEPASGKGNNHSECFKFYWNDSKNNPMIDKSTIKFRTNNNMSIVEYDLAGEFQGNDFRMPNVNYYLYKNNNCIDIHISKLPFNKSDHEIFKSFESSIKISNL